MVIKNKVLVVWAEAVDGLLGMMKKEKTVLHLTGVMHHGRDHLQAKIEVDLEEEVTEGEIEGTEETEWIEVISSLLSNQIQFDLELNFLKIR